MLRREWFRYPFLVYLLDRSSVVDGSFPRIVYARRRSFGNHCSRRYAVCYHLVLKCEVLFRDSDNVPDFLWQELVQNLQQTVSRAHGSDTLEWSKNLEGCFTVNSCYNRFKVKLFGPPLNL